MLDVLAHKFGERRQVHVGRPFSVNLAEHGMFASRVCFPTPFGGVEQLAVEIGGGSGFCPDVYRCLHLPEDIPGWLRCP